VNAKAGALSRLSEITISDGSGLKQTLWFGPEVSGIDAAEYEMPPIPPSGAFDARFATQRMVELVGGTRPADLPILVSGATGPLSIGWRIRRVTAALLVDGKSVALNGEGSLNVPASVEQAGLRMRLILSPAQVAETPKEYALDQNYPNPFNPSTELRYRIPRESHVVLKIYDVLGEEVATLVDRNDAPGEYTVQWDGGNLGGGVYFARLKAEQFIQSRKILLVK
jgi:hypothetical protein